MWEREGGEIRRVRLLGGVVSGGGFLGGFHFERKVFRGANVPERGPKTVRVMDVAEEVRDSVAASK